MNGDICGLVTIVVPAGFIVVSAVPVGLAAQLIHADYLTMPRPTLSLVVLMVKVTGVSLYFPGVQLGA